MIVSYSKGFVFIHIHKTAGESVTNALAPHLGRGDVVAGRSSFGALRNTYVRKRFGFKKHMTAAAVKKNLGESWDTLFTFSFVRNPYDRVRSLYYFIENVEKRRSSPSIRNLQYRLPLIKERDPRRWPALRAYKETKSFSEFIRHPGFLKDRIGTRPQLAMLSDSDGKIIVDFVGRFENLSEEFRIICERLSIPAELGWQNVSRNSSKRNFHLPQADRDFLYDLYKEDFEAFGYSKA